MILPIVIYGSAILRKQAQTIDLSYPDLRELIENMYETMLRAEGIGLAAPQIGLSIQLITIDASALGEDYPECKDLKLTLINPEIIAYIGNDELIEEGCLSLPGLRGDVSRSEGIEVSYLDENGVLQNRTFHGFASRVVQHELDHLEGKVFTDRMSPMKRRMLQSRLNSMRKGKVDAKYKVRIG